MTGASWVRVKLEHSVPEEECRRKRGARGARSTGHTGLATPAGHPRRRTAPGLRSEDSAPPGALFRSTPDGVQRRELVRYLEPLVGAANKASSLASSRLPWMSTILATIRGGFSAVCGVGG